MWSCSKFLGRGGGVQKSFSRIDQCSVAFIGNNVRCETHFEGSNRIIFLNVQAILLCSHHFWPFLTFINQSRLYRVNSGIFQGILKSDTILEILG